MKCGACRLDIPDELVRTGYRCPHCHSVLSYWRLVGRFRKAWLLLGVSVLIGFAVHWLYPLWAAVPAYRAKMAHESLKEGDTLPIAKMLQLLQLKDENWVYGEKHEKGHILHLRNLRFKAEHVIVFVHGFGGDYLSTWGTLAKILEEPRFNRSYEFAFYGYATGLNRPVRPFSEQSADLNDLLDKLGRRYKTITVVAHSKGGLLTARALLDRHLESLDPKSGKRSHRLHRIVLFAPITQNVYLYGDEVRGVAEKVFAKKESDLQQIQNNTYSEITGVHRDLDKIMESPGDEMEKQRFTREVLERLYVIHAEGDAIVDMEKDGRKTCNRWLLKIDQEQTIPGPRHYQVLSRKEIDWKGNFLTEKVRPIAYPHTHIVKLGQQSRYFDLARFEELLWDRIGIPPRSGGAEREQLARNIRDTVAEKVHEMNRFVAEKDPLLGLAWDDIGKAVQERIELEFPEARNPEIGKDALEKVTAFKKEIVAKLYYTYIFLDLYQRLSDMRQEGILSENDETLSTWRTQWIPQLMKSDLGKWMLHKRLDGYYSKGLQHQFEQMADGTLLDRASEKERNDARDKLWSGIEPAVHVMNGLNGNSRDRTAASLSSVNDLCFPLR